MNQAMIDNLLSGLFGAIIVTAFSALVQWRFILRSKREAVAVHIRKLRLKVELNTSDTNGVFDTFKEYKDLIEDSTYAYSCYVLWPPAIRKAIAAYCGYAENHPYRSVYIMPENKNEFLERIDKLERALRIADFPGRHERR